MAISDVTNINRNGSVNCMVYGQPGTRSHWSLNGTIIKHSKNYITTVKERRISDFNNSYTFNLYVLPSILDYFANTTDTNCYIVEGNNVTCILVYSCSAYYVEDETSEKQTTVIFTGYNGK